VSLAVPNVHPVSLLAGSRCWGGILCLCPQCPRGVPRVGGGTREGSISIPGAQQGSLGQVVAPRKGSLVPRAQEGTPGQVVATMGDVHPTLVSRGGRRVGGGTRKGSVSIPGAQRGSLGQVVAPRRGSPVPGAKEGSPGRWWHPGGVHPILVSRGGPQGGWEHKGGIPISIPGAQRASLGQVVARRRVCPIPGAEEWSSGQVVAPMGDVHPTLVSRGGPQGGWWHQGGIHLHSWCPRGVPRAGGGNRGGGSPNPSV